MYFCTFYRNGKCICRVFDTLADACAYASHVFDTQGIVAGIESTLD
jgi:hypothetical protein